MDRARFDALTRALATSGSRREALGALIGVALLGESPDALAKRGKNRGRGDSHGHGKAEVSAQDRRHRKHRRKGKANALSANCFDGSPCIAGNGKNLQNCDLSASSTLKDASCTGCNLGGVNLRKADASGAMLNKANLGNACLVDADLTGANLTKSNLTGAVFCRTTMPDGSNNNSGCNKGTNCCPTCAKIGEACGNGLGGGCCGGAGCVGNLCACPANSPLNCNGVCKDCCDDTDCPGATPHCCDGICKVCCAPDPVATTCAGELCGTVMNNCGQPVNCGPCAEIACNPGLCGLDNTCLRAIDPDLTACTTSASAAGICCSGACFAGNCCAAADCPGSSDDCVGHVCRCGAGPACGEPAETCCAGVCKDTTTDPVNCGSCGHACTSAGAPHCANGSCGCATNGNQPCAAGLTCCANGCKDLQSDPQNCNFCGHVCFSDGQCETATCTNGVCGIEISPNNVLGQPGCGGELVCCEGGCCNTLLYDTCAVDSLGVLRCCAPSGFPTFAASHCCSGQRIGLNCV